MTASTEVARNSNGVMDQVASLRDGLGIYSTIQGTDTASKVAILNAVTNAVSVSDHLGETIQLRNVVVQATTVTDDATGVERDALRTILIAEDGTAYAAMSDGVFKALQNIFGIMGQPETWTEPLPVTVIEAKGRKGFRFMTIKVAL